MCVSCLFMQPHYFGFLLLGVDDGNWTPVGLRAQSKQLLRGSISAEHLVNVALG